MTCLFSKCAVRCIGHVISPTTRQPSWPGGDSPGAGAPRYKSFEFVLTGAPKTFVAEVY